MLRTKITLRPAAAALLLAVAVAGTSPAQAQRDAAVEAAAPATQQSAASAAACASLVSLSIPNATIDSAVATPAATVRRPFGNGPGTRVPETCRVHVTATTPGAHDRIGIDVWLPAAGWNGRFEGVGGGGYSTGDPRSLAAPVADGYAAGATDGGHEGASALTGAFALDAEGRLDWPLIEDFSYRSLHDLAVVGKTVTATYYGRYASHSYWSGCSTGGREGLAEAQRYPTDYDGILAGAPAINWQKFIPAELWPQLVMQRSGDVLPQCKLEAFRAAAIEACDAAGDNVDDGVIGDPLACRFDPASLVGRSTACGTITDEDAAVVAKIVTGPRTTSGEFLWYGLTWGAPFGGLPYGGLGNTTTANGKTTGAPFPIALSHLGTWVQQTPPAPAGAWDWSATTYRQYDLLFRQSVEMYGDVIGTDDPDLGAFAKAGGKLIIWHGLADPLIFPQGTIDYYERVAEVTGGRRSTTDFARLFLAPGVYHCGGGPGAQPRDPLQQLVDWVEDGRAPASLDGVIREASTGAITATRPICMYPGTAAYEGKGSTKEATSFVCRASGGESRGSP